MVDILQKYSMSKQFALGRKELEYIHASQLFAIVKQLREQIRDELQIFFLFREIICGKKMLHI